MAPPRAVADTNVLVAAAISPQGVCGRLVDAAIHGRWRAVALVDGGGHGCVDLAQSPVGHTTPMVVCVGSAQPGAVDAEPAPLTASPGRPGRPGRRRARPGAPA
ncbi:MAG: PIN domain-containing protein [Actinomycetota bacterium]|nr:PIN domain-containing protein [Actinomycetota bacterium]